MKQNKLESEVITAIRNYVKLCFGESYRTRDLKMIVGKGKKDWRVSIEFKVYDINPTKIKT